MLLRLIFLYFTMNVSANATESSALETSGLQAVLLAALGNSRLDVFKRLLQMVDDGNTPVLDPNYFYAETDSTTCVHEACTEEKSSEYLRALLRANADPNLMNVVTSKAPIHVAISCKNLPVVWLLLEQADLNVNVGDENGDTPLHYVVRFVDDELHADLLVRQMIENKADVYIKNGLGKSAIMDAAVLQREKLVKAMLPENYKQKKITNRVTLQLFLKTLLPNLEDVVKGDRANNYKMNTLKNKLFRMLYSENYNDFLNELGQCQINDQQMKELLNMNDGKNTFLQTVCSLSQSENVVKVLLEKGVDPNRTTMENGSPSLVISAEKKKYDVMKILLHDAKEKVNVNEKDSKGNTALHVIVEDRNLEMVIELLKAGAEMTIKNNLGIDSISMAAMKDLMDISLQRVENGFKLCFGLFIQRKERGTEPASVSATNDHRPSAVTSTYLAHDGAPLIVSDQKKNNRNGPELENVELVEMNSPHLHRVSSPGQGNLEGGSANSPVQGEIKISRAGNVHSGVADQTELVGLYYILKTYRDDCILKHPLVRSFILLKLFKFEFYFLLKFIMTTFLNLLMLVNIICHHHARQTECKKKQYEPGPIILLSLLWGVTFLLECFEFVIAPRRYFCQIKNYVPLGLMICIAVFFFFFNFDNDDFQLTLAVAIQFLGWSAMFVAMGKFYMAYMELFKAVAKNAIIFLFWYMLLLIPFPLSYMILPGGNMASNISSTINDGKIDVKHIQFNWITILTIVLYAAFVILVGLYNLMMSLAVRGFKDITETASLQSIRSQVTFMKDVERFYTKLNRCKISLISRIFSSKKIYFLNYKGDSVYIYPNIKSLVFIGDEKRKHGIYRDIHSEIVKIIGAKFVTMSDSSSQARK